MPEQPVVGEAENQTQSLQSFTQNLAAYQEMIFPDARNTAGDKRKTFGDDESIKLQLDIIDAITNDSTDTVDTQKKDAALTFLLTHKENLYTASQGTNFDQQFAARAMIQDILALDPVSQTNARLQNEFLTLFSKEAILALGDDDGKLLVGIALSTDAEKSEAAYQRLKEILYPEIEQSAPDTTDSSDIPERPMTILMRRLEEQKVRMNVHRDIVVMKDLLTANERKLHMEMPSLRIAANVLFKYGIESPSSFLTRSLERIYTENSRDEADAAGEEKIIVSKLSLMFNTMIHLESENSGILRFLDTTYSVRDYGGSFPIARAREAYLSYQANPQQFMEEQQQRLDDAQAFLQEKLGEAGIALFGFYQDTSDKPLSNFHQDRERLMGEVDAIKALEEVAPGAAMYLHEELGIRNFSNYPLEILTRAYEVRDQENISYGTLLTAVHDWNDSFAKEKSVLADLNEQVQDNVVLIPMEAATKQEAVHILNKVRKKYGKARFMLISAHGNEGLMQLGKIDPKATRTTNERRYVAIDDFVRPGAQALGSVVEDDATIILSSCSTGKVPDHPIHPRHKNIASALVSVVAGRRIIAPEGKTTLEKITVTTDENNKMTFEATYKYDVAAVEYLNEKTLLGSMKKRFRGILPKRWRK